MNRHLDALSHVLDRLAEHVVLFRWGDLLFVRVGFATHRQKVGSW